MTMEFQNQVSLEGCAASSPSFSHENHGTRFYRFPLCISRLSGQEDLLPVLVPESRCELVQPGASLRLTGQLRSYNNPSGQGRRLILSIFPLTLEAGSGGDQNQILLQGNLCKPPILRRTPLGRNICDLMLAVPRPYGRTDYLPVIAWGQLAAEVSTLSVGDPLGLMGRVQSRSYQKVTEHGVEERVAYEVSMMDRREEPFLSEETLNPLDSVAFTSSNPL